MRNAYNIHVVKPERKKPFQRSEHRWKNELQRILRKQYGYVWTGCIWLRIAVMSPSEHCYEPSGSIKGGEFLSSELLLAFQERLCPH
jgi:hypothetical protein